MVGFDFTSHMRHLCADLVTRLDDLRHIDLNLVAIRFCQTRQMGPYGTQASLTPLRFSGGERETHRRGRRYRVQPVVESGKEMLYLLSFYLPRFLDRPLKNKLETVVHELWHIGPAFDGDVRRHDGRCYAHTGSKKKFDATIELLTGKWLGLDPPAERYAFLTLNFRQLERTHGPVFGQRIATPRLLPVGNNL